MACGQSWGIDSTIVDELDWAYDKRDVKVGLCSLNSIQ
jgi:hypothetical protein